MSYTNPANNPLAFPLLELAESGEPPFPTRSPVQSRALTQALKKAAAVMTKFTFDASKGSEVAYHFWLLVHGLLGAAHKQLLSEQPGVVLGVTVPTFALGKIIAPLLGETSLMQTSAPISALTAADTANSNDSTRVLLATLAGVIFSFAGTVVFLEVDTSGSEYVKHGLYTLYAPRVLTLTLDLLRKWKPQLSENSLFNKLSEGIKSPYSQALTPSTNFALTFAIFAYQITNIENAGREDNIELNSLTIDFLLIFGFVGAYLLRLSSAKFGEKYAILKVLDKVQDTALLGFKVVFMVFTLIFAAYSKKHPGILTNADTYKDYESEILGVTIPLIIIFVFSNALCSHYLKGLKKLQVTFSNDVINNWLKTNFPDWQWLNTNFKHKILVCLKALCYFLYSIIWGMLRLVNVDTLSQLWNTPGDDLAALLKGHDNAPATRDGEDNV